MFVALAPATTATGFSNKYLDSLTKMSPDIVYLMFGKRSLLSSVIFWQNLLSTKAFCQLIDSSCKFLFGWDMKNITAADKPILYSHIYSYSSVKAVVHWFQIMRSQRFQMYDDKKWEAAFGKYTGDLAPAYPISQIPCPIAVFYGGRDSLPDTKSLLKQLPKSSVVVEEPSYEHMDFLYSRHALQSVYPRLLQLLGAAHFRKRDSPDSQLNVSASSLSHSPQIVTPPNERSESKEDSSFLLLTS